MSVTKNGSGGALGTVVHPGSACRIIDSAVEESTFDSLEAVLNFQESTVIIVL
jgi:hypothetical protein